MIPAPCKDGNAPNEEKTKCEPCKIGFYKNATYSYHSTIDLDYGSGDGSGDDFSSLPETRPYYFLPCQQCPNDTPETVDTESIGSEKCLGKLISLMFLIGILLFIDLFD